MRRLEQLCTQYLENTINHHNVLTGLHYASKLNLFFIKEYCLKFIVKESNFTQIVMTHEFETVERELMVDIIRRRQMPQIRQLLEPHFETVCSSIFFLDSLKHKFFLKVGTSLEEDMDAFLNGGGKEFCDIVLKLESEQVPAHKAILAARCSYFQVTMTHFQKNSSS